VHILSTWTWSNFETRKAKIKFRNSRNKDRTRTPVIIVFGYIAVFTDLPIRWLHAIKYDNEVARFYVPSCLLCIFWAHKQWTCPDEKHRSNMMVYARTYIVRLYRCLHFSNPQLQSFVSIKPQSWTQTPLVTSCSIHDQREIAKCISAECISSIAFVFRSIVFAIKVFQ